MYVRVVGTGRGGGWEGRRVIVGMCLCVFYACFVSLLRMLHVCVPVFAQIFCKSTPFFFHIKVFISEILLLFFWRSSCKLPIERSENHHVCIFAMGGGQE